MHIGPHRGSQKLWWPCLSICPQAYLQNLSDLHQIFCVFYLRPWLGPPLAELRWTLRTSCFVNDVMFISCVHVSRKSWRSTHSCCSLRCWSCFSSSSSSSCPRPRARPSRTSPVPSRQQKQAGSRSQCHVPSPKLFPSSNIVYRLQD